MSEFGRLTNYNGVAIEQSSSLLLVAILAGIRALFGIAPHDAGPILSAASAATVIVAVAWLSRLAGMRCWFAPPLFLSVSLPFVYWSTSGTEASLASLLVIVAIAIISTSCSSEERQHRGTTILGVVTLMGIAVVRPETPLVLSLFVC